MIWKRVVNFLTVPSDIREEFYSSCLRKNKTSLLIISIMIYLIEAFNVIRVLFMSRSGLSSLNNRLYFYMYCILMGVTTVYLFLQRLFSNRSVTFQQRMQYIAIIFFLLWDISLNTYDLISDPNGEIYVFTTAVLGMAIFLHLSNRFSIPCLGIGYLLFMLLNRHAISQGTSVNLAITVLVAMGVSIAQCHHNVVEIIQRREINKINRQLEALLEQDQMLSILNKSAFEYRLQNTLGLVDASNTISVLMLDLDDFKSVNDRYGHPCGDYVLMQVAKFLKEVFCEEDQLIGRLGGDEFAVLQLHSITEKRLEKLAEQFLAAISEIRWNGTSLPVGCSIGIIQVRKTNLTYNELYKEVDQLLYSVKRDQKGRYQFKILV